MIVTIQINELEFELFQLFLSPNMYDYNT